MPDRSLALTSISSDLRCRLLLLLAASLRTLRTAPEPLFRWLRPRNAQGLLLSMALLAFLLRLRCSMQSMAAATSRRRACRKLMTGAATYDEWVHAAKMLESEEPMGSAVERRLYDEELVRSKLEDLRRRRKEGSARDMAFYLRADLLRNLGNMCNPKLHKGRLQVPELITEYIEEVSSQLKMVCSSDDADGLRPDEKLAFVHETRHAFGRTALLLSGGACLGSFHVGVVRTLAKHKLLPRIIVGSSAGSIISAIASTRTDSELEGFFQSSLGTLQFFDSLGGVFDVLRRIAAKGAVHEIRQLQALLREVTGNRTFQEAYDLTRRVLCVTVCSPRPREGPRCLNYLTAPHVLIWSAVTASCAFPGLFPAQELMAKNQRGEVVPYQPAIGEDDAAAARLWRDGSLENDLPMEHLRELFNVNHFIVSQANPHITPILRLKEFVRGYLGDFPAKMGQVVEMEVKNRCKQILELGIPIGTGLAKLFAQDWEGDITIVMPATLSQYLKILKNPTYSDLKKSSDQGCRCTWEKLPAIRANCAIELALDECAALLDRAHRLRRRADMAASARRLVVLCRLPSWISQSSRISSSDETSRTPTPRSSDYTTDESQQESPGAHSWARAGGPLYRSCGTDAEEGTMPPWSPERRGPPPPRSPLGAPPSDGDYLGR